MVDYTVTTLADSDPDNTETTLREAIMMANAQEGADRIGFADGLAGQIMLTGGTLGITDDLEIDGATDAAGPIDITVNAGGMSGVFSVMAGDVTFSDLGIVGGFALQGGGVYMAAETDVTLDGAHVADNTATGDAATDGGGGVYNAGGTLTVTNSTIADNEANGLAGSGGNIFAFAGSTAITDSTVSGGAASRAGGGVEVGTGSVEIEDSFLTGNTTGNTPGNGGALHVTGGEADTTVEIRGTVISGNDAGAEGGGLWNNAGATMIVSDSVIRDNVAFGDDADQGGGGIYNNGGTLTVTDSTLDANGALGTAGSGGNLFSTEGMVSIDDSTISDGMANRAGGGIEVVAGTLAVTNSWLAGNSTGSSPGNGGALHVTGAAQTTVDGTLVSGNVAASEGGGLWNSASGAMTVIDSVFRSNDAQGDGADNGGGGIFNDGGDLSVTGSVFSENMASGDAGSGGGLMATGGSDVIVESSIFSANTAMRAGGAVELANGAAGSDFIASFTAVDFFVNSAGAAPGNGGAIHTTGAGEAGPSTLTISGADFSGNVAASEGGGLWTDAGWTTTVANTLFLANEAQGDAADNGGGGLFNNGGTVSVTDSSFEANMASGDAGSGGNLFSTAGSLSIEDSDIVGGMANRAGGGIEVIDGTLDVTGTLLAGNGAGDAPGNGGAVHASGAAEMTISDSGVIDNVAANEGGGLWNSGTGTLTVVNTELSGNDAPEGSAVYSVGGPVAIVASLILDNRPDGGAVTVTGEGGLRIVETGIGSADPILGGDGGDMVFGGAGGQVISGGGGNDTLVGEAGADLLAGGDGNDVFAFLANASAEADVIGDFGDGDLLAIDDRFFAAFAEDGVSPRGVTQAQARAALDSGKVSYDRASGEFAIDDTVIAVLEGDVGLSFEDVLLF